MKDKQNFGKDIDVPNKTIIDGVDVSGCECYSEHREGYCGWFTLCEGDSCQYKLDWALQQLKAKEQECEFSNLRIIQLQETLSQYETDLSTKDCIVETCKAQYKELKAENEKLKEFQKLLEEQMAFNKSELEWSLSSEIKRSEILLKAFKKADKQKDNWREKAEKLLKTLAEIKGLSQSITDEFEDMDTEQQLCYCQQISTQILNKISEVVDD